MLSQRKAPKVLNRLGTVHQQDGSGRYTERWLQLKRKQAPTNKHSGSVITLSASHGILQGRQRTSVSSYCKQHKHTQLRYATAIMQPTDSSPHQLTAGSPFIHRSR